MGQGVREGERWGVAEGEGGSERQWKKCKCARSGYGGQYMDRQDTLSDLTKHKIYLPETSAYVA